MLLVTAVILSPGPSALLKWRAWRSLAYKPVDKTTKTLQESCSICNATHDEMAFSEVISSDMKSVCFYSNLNPLFKLKGVISSYFMRQNTPGFLACFGSLVLGLLRPPF